MISSDRFRLGEEWYGRVSTPYSGVKATVANVTNEYLIVIFNRTVQVQGRKMKAKLFRKSFFVTQFDPKHEQTSLFE